MNKYVGFNKIKKDAVIVGCHWRWDVATKARVVEYIITHGIDAKEGSMKSKYENIAELLNVNWQSIVNWVRQYRYTYKEAKKAPRGTIIYSPIIIKRGKESKAFKKIRELHVELYKLRKAVEHAPKATIDVDSLRDFLKPIQEELTETSIKSE